MMRLWQVLLCGLLLLVGAVALAQDDAAVLLQYKFVPGRTVVYEVTGNGTVPMSLTTGPEAGNQTIALDMAMDLRIGMKETCEGLDEEGKGKMVMSLPLMVIQVNTAVGDQAIASFTTWENNALSVTVNGQTIPPDANVQKLETLLKTPIRLTMSPAGAAKLDEETAKLLGDMLNNPLGGFSQSLNALTGGFSDQPVRPGETWKTALTGEQTNGALEGTADCTFAGFEDLGGVRCARIEGEAQVKSLKPLPNISMGGQGESAITAMGISMAFVNYFDPAAGHMVLSIMDMTQNMSMIVTVGGQGGAQGLQMPATIENSQMHMEMRHQPAK
jgi:hypothetical protein